jgi:hypothetical protein
MNTKRLTIAVFGSWREPQDQRRNEGVQGSRQEYFHALSRETFQQACRDLGRELASACSRVLVASDSPSTIDFHIVQGIVEVAATLEAKSPPLVVIRSAARLSSKGGQDCATIHEKAIHSNPHLFEAPVALTDMANWEDVHDYMVEHADRILILGGGASSHRIAVRALASGKLVVPIGTFGGAGLELNRMLENVRDERNFPKYEYRRVLAGATWGSAQLDTSLYALGVKGDPEQRRKIFINYRRSDTNIAAGWLYSKLCSVFSKGDVFLDTASIDVGDHFDAVIVSTLRKTALFLTIIGPRWLTTTDDQTGQRRLDAPRDFVRREIEIALQEGIRIIPVCVEGAQVPKVSALPPSIAELPEHNAHFISNDNLEDEFNALVAHIKKVMDHGPTALP